MYMSNAVECPKRPCAMEERKTTTVVATCELQCAMLPTHVHVRSLAWMHYNMHDVMVSKGRHAKSSVIELGAFMTLCTSACHGLGCCTPVL